MRIDSPNFCRRFFASLFCATVLILLGCTSAVFGQAPAKPVSHSYVRGLDADGRLRIAIYDAELPVILKNSPYTAIDVVMQQCHSGGFLSYMSSNPPVADWTFSSSCAASETANNLEKIDVLGQNFAGYIDNFTRAWRDDAQLSPFTGMKQHYLTALKGNGAVMPPILQDRFAPGAAPSKFLYIRGSVYDIFTGTVQGVTGQYIWSRFNSGFGENGSVWVQVKPTGTNIMVGTNSVPSWIALSSAYSGIEKNTPYPQYTSTWTSEHPQYASAGAKSDQRTLGFSGTNTNNVQQYAILVQWDVPNRSTDVSTKYAYSYAVNMDRLAVTLQSNYGVSNGNIAALYYDGTFGSSTNLPAFPIMWPGAGGASIENLNSFGPISGPSGTNADGKAVFADLAVPGKLFRTNGVAGALPGTNAHLLVYFTGHGGTTTDKVKLKYSPDPMLDYELLPADAINPDGTPDAPGFDAVGELKTAVASFLATTNDLADLPSNAGIFDYQSNVLDGFQGVSDLIQITTTTPIPSYVQLVINGYTNTSLSPLMPVSPGSATLYDLDPLVPGLLDNYYTYQVTVDSTVLNQNISINSAGQGTSQGTIDIGFSGLQPSDFNPNLVKAVIIRGPDEEVAYVPPDLTVATNLHGQNLSGGLLLTWPPGQTNYYIQENADLNTTNWVTVTSPGNLAPELTGQADLTLPMGTNWAFFSFTNSQMFFRLVPSP